MDGEPSDVHLDAYFDACKDTSFISTKHNVASDSRCLSAHDTDSLQNNIKCLVSRSCFRIYLILCSRQVIHLLVCYDCSSLIL